MLTLDATFHALSDPTRRQILSRLARSETSISELAEPFNMTLPAVTKHLGVLRRAGLIEQRRTGRVRTCRLVGQPLQDAANWLVEYRRFWEGQLDSLEHFFEEHSDVKEPLK
jgi:DNA-binding transcriptional ArsR family regulator